MTSVFTARLPQVIQVCWDCEVTASFRKWITLTFPLINIQTFSLTHAVIRSHAAMLKLKFNLDMCRYTDQYHCIVSDTFILRPWCELVIFGFGYKKMSKSLWELCFSKSFHLKPQMTKMIDLDLKYKWFDLEMDRKLHYFHSEVVV